MFLPAAAWNPPSAAAGGRDGCRGSGQSQGWHGDRAVGTASSSTGGWHLQTDLLSGAKRDQGVPEEISSGSKQWTDVKPAGKVTPPPKSVGLEQILSGSKGRRGGRSEKKGRKEQEFSWAAEKDRMERG